MRSRPSGRFRRTSPGPARCHGPHAAGRNRAAELVRYFGMRWPHLQIIGHPVAPYATVEFLRRQRACLDLGDAPRFQIVLLMKAHRLAVIGRVGPLDPKVLLVIRAADAHGAEVVDLAALALADGEWAAFCRPHVERVAIGGEALMQLFIGGIDGVFHRGRNAAVRFRVGALATLASLYALWAFVQLLNAGHAKRVGFAGSERAIRI